MKGGARPGAGRKPGARNKRTVEREKKVAEAAALVGDALAEKGLEPFDGDAHAYLMAVYKNPAVDIGDRIDAAKAAISFEKPKLAAVTLSGDEEKPVVVDDKTRARALHALLARLKAGKQEAPGA